MNKTLKTPKNAPRISAEKMLELMKSYEIEIFKFNRDSPSLDFVPMTCPPTKDGMYLTIRCGLSGISTSINQWKDSSWQKFCLDASQVIAYSRNQIDLFHTNE